MYAQKEMQKMKDTHGQVGQGWYGFDLDGTLAKYDGWKGISHIGEPIAPMVELIKRYHSEGKVVKIMTARVAPRLMKINKPNGERLPFFTSKFPFINFGDVHQEIEQFDWVERQGVSFENGYAFADGVYYDKVYAHDYIEKWCEKNLGFVPEIVYQKDSLMLWLFDDRVVQVEPNTGIVLGKLPNE